MKDIKQMSLPQALITLFLMGLFISALFGFCFGIGVGIYEVVVVYIVGG